ncbi:hypothetical protein [Pelagibius marinus]|uniref:hypothetical protein n=1 Tax=Pelagibius marinus TaxID=2762760 RepID=UPI001872B4E9|nr:hypothetical protein [Pelagibius marinus]
MSSSTTSYIVCAGLLFGTALVTDAGRPLAFEPPVAKEGFSYPESYCTNRGTRIELGELACLRVNGKAFVASCGMHQNNPMWRKVQDGCPAQLEKASGMAPAASPAGDGGNQ